MNEAIISSTVDLLSGGCNACESTEQVLYTLNLGGKDVPLDELTVSELVMAVVLRSGYKQELEMDYMDEYIVFKKEHIKVTLHESYNQVKYSDGVTTIKTQNIYDNMEELGKKVNEILTTVFGIAAINFIGETNKT